MKYSLLGKKRHIEFKIKKYILSQKYLYERKNIEKYFTLICDIAK